MKNTLLLCAPMFLTFIANAAPMLIVGTPANSQLSTPTPPSPNVVGGISINFDSLTPFTTFSPTTYASQGVTISSPDGLEVLPFSTQSAPNELFDNSSNGTANLTIRLLSSTAEIGIGVADSDPVSITLQALNASGNPFGTQFTVNLAATESKVNTGNGFYLLDDTSTDIYGLQILQTTGNANYSGLAIDNLVTEPEPSTFSLMLAAVLAGAIGLAKRA